MDRFISLKDAGRNYLDTLTGETVSKRQRDKALRGSISNEMAAKMNKITNPELALSRPARGRTSLLKKSATERELIAQARIENEQRKLEQHKRDIAEKARLRMLARKANKKVNRKTISTRLLKAGHMGARVPFNTYAEYLVMLKEAKATGQIIAYGLGMQGFHENTGQDVSITVFTLMSVTNKPIPEDVFEETFDEEIESRSYFVFQHYWMHVAFKKEYAAARKEKAKTRKAKRK